MSVADGSPSDDDVLKALDFEIEEPTDVVDLTKLTPLELSDLEYATKKRLHEIHEMFAPPQGRTEEGKELHSRYLALQVEKQRRGW